MIVASPDTETHSPEELRKEMLMCGSDSMSLVLPDSVFVKKRRFTPPLSYFLGGAHADRSGSPLLSGHVSHNV